jgi:hypothetical protein
LQQLGNVLLIDLNLAILEMNGDLVENIVVVELAEARSGSINGSFVCRDLLLLLLRGRAMLFYSVCTLVSCMPA